MKLLFPLPFILLVSCVAAEFQFGHVPHITVGSDKCPPLEPGVHPSNPAHSCMEVFRRTPDTASGYYYVQGEDDIELVYCDAVREFPCSGGTGGWMRIANLDMRQSHHTCPGEWQLRTGHYYRGKRLCGRPPHYDGCSSAVFPVFGIPYRQVCGRIVAYQDTTPDGFCAHNTAMGQGGCGWSSQLEASKTIDGAYVDGISVTTHGSQRQHIWTLVVGLHEDQSAGPEFKCPCFGSGPVIVPAFVGEDYYCDTGSQIISGGLFEKQLFQGTPCKQHPTCCRDGPIFCQTLAKPTTDDVEVRICADQNIIDEDIPIEAVELYVR